MLPPRRALPTAPLGTYQPAPAQGGVVEGERTMKPNLRAGAYHLPHGGGESHRHLPVCLNGRRRRR